MSEERQAGVLNEQFFIDALKENAESIKRHVREQIMNGITRQFQWELPEVIKKQVSKFMEEEIAPEIQKQLINDKAIIVDAATVAVQGIALEVAKGLQKAVADQMAHAWGRSKIAKALFE